MEGTCSTHFLRLPASTGNVTAQHCSWEQGTSDTPCPKQCLRKTQEEVMGMCLVGHDKCSPPLKGKHLQAHPIGLARGTIFNLHGARLTLCHGANRTYAETTSAGLTSCQLHFPISCVLSPPHLPLNSALTNTG